MNFEPTAEEIAEVLEWTDRNIGRYWPRLKYLGEFLEAVGAGRMKASVETLIQIQDELTLHLDVYYAGLGGRYREMMIERSEPLIREYEEARARTKEAADRYIAKQAN